MQPNDIVRNISCEGGLTQIEIHYEGTNYLLGRRFNLAQEADQKAIAKINKWIQHNPIKLAEHLFKGESFGPCEELAYRIYERHQAHYMSGLCLEKGIGTEKDHERARTHYKQGEAEGNTLCIDRLCRSLLCGVGKKGKPRKPRKALNHPKIPLYREAQCRQFLGEDEKKVFELYQKSWKEDNNQKALKHLGACYEYGEGVEKDLEKARQYYFDCGTLKALVKYLVLSQKLGRCPDFKPVLEKLSILTIKSEKQVSKLLFALQLLNKDVKESESLKFRDVFSDVTLTQLPERDLVRWCRTAAQQGHAFAQNALSACFFSGIGIAVVCLLVRAVYSSAF